MKDVVDELRDEGERVGLLEIRSFRPFPAERRARWRSSGVETVVVLDRADSPGGRRRSSPRSAAALHGSAPREFESTSTGSAAATSIPRTSARCSRAGAAAPRYVGLRSEPCPA